MKYNTMTEDFKAVNAIINSCKTKKQLPACRNMALNFFKKHERNYHVSAKTFTNALLALIEVKNNQLN